MSTNGRSFSADRFPPAHAAASLPPSRAPDAPAPPAVPAAHEVPPRTPSDNRKPCQTPYDEGHSDLHSVHLLLCERPRPQAFCDKRRLAVKLPGALGGIESHIALELYAARRGATHPRIRGDEAPAIGVALRHHDAVERMAICSSMSSLADRCHNVQATSDAPRSPVLNPHEVS